MAPAWQELFDAIRARAGLNAFVHLAERSDALSAAQRALAARDPDARLAGVPVAVKDNIAVAGMPWSNGIGARREVVAGEDAEVVRRLRTAGMVVVGKLNMHEAALGATTANPHFGPCHNPRRHGFTPGGSSGGSGAAVAAGLVPAALGTDTMGSVRIPAAYCGCVGLLPSRGRVSRWGVVPLSTTLDTVGVLAACVDDAATVLWAMSGHDPRDPQSRPGARVTSRPLTCGSGSPEGSSERARLAGLRLAVYDGGTRTEAPLRAAVERLAAQLASQGARIRRVDALPVDAGRLRRAGLLVSEVEGHAANLPWLEHPEVSDELRRNLAYGAGLGAERIEQCHERLRVGRLAWFEAMRSVDAWLLPTAPQRAFSFDSPVPDDQADLTVHANAAGLPAVSLPAGFDEEGLPLAVQLLGRPNADEALVAIARVVESLVRPA